MESDELEWLFGDLAGHPVEPCPYKFSIFAPKEERSLFWFFLADFDRLPYELKVQKDFWTKKGLGRINDWFWKRYFPELETPENGLVPEMEVPEMEVPEVEMTEVDMLEMEEETNEV